MLVATNLAVGDRVIISCGWNLGHLIDGTQAERVRVPFADTSIHLLPKGVSMEEAVMLADILPTAYAVGVINGRVWLRDTAQRVAELTDGLGAHVAIEAVG